MKNKGLFLLLTSFILVLSGCSDVNKPADTVTPVPLQVSAPVLDPPEGELASVPVDITFTSATDGVIFHYTMDGTDPTSASTDGTSCRLTGPAVLKVIASKDGMTDSEITTASYTVKAIPSSDADLASLVPSMGIFQPNFTPDQLTYNIIIPESQSSIILTPEASGPGTTITQNGDTVTSGSAGTAVSVNAGGTIAYRIVAEDGTTEKTYTLTMKTVDQDSWDTIEPEGTCNRNYFTDFATSHDGTVLATIHDRLHFSINSGTSWAEYPDSEERNWDCSAVSGDGTVIGGTYTEDDEAYFVQSRNGGDTWKSPVKIGEGRIFDVALSSDGTYIYTAVYNYSGAYLRMSSDGGTTWSDITSPGQESWINVECSSDGTRVLASYGSTGLISDSKVLWLSSDSGATWASQEDLSSYFNYLSLTADGMKIVAGAFGKYIRVSTDFGTTWDEFTKKADCLSYSPDGSLLIISSYNGTSYDLFVSEDDGEYWTDYEDMTWPAKVLAPTSDGNTIYATKGNTHGFAKVSENKGADWTDIKNIGRRDWTDVAISPEDGQFQAALFDDGSEGILFLSDDFGSSWTENTALPSSTWRNVSLSNDGQTILITGEEKTKLALSSDGGQSWSDTTLESEYDDWQGQAVSSDGNTLLALQDYGSPFISLDGGSSWSTISGPADGLHWTAAAVSRDGNSMAIAGKELWTSTDGGTTWTNLNKDGFWNDVDISEDGTHILLVYTSGKDIEYTTDGGVNWEKTDFKNSDYPYPISARLSSYGEGIVLAMSKSYYYADDLPTSPGDLLISMNGGTTWDSADGAGMSKWTAVDASSDLSVIAGVALDQKGITINK